MKKILLALLCLPLYLMLSGCTHTQTSPGQKHMLSDNPSYYYEDTALFTAGVSREKYIHFFTLYQQGKDKEFYDAFSKLTNEQQFSFYPARPSDQSTEHTVRVKPFHSGFIFLMNSRRGVAYFALNNSGGLTYQEYPFEPLMFPDHDIATIRKILSGDSSIANQEGYQKGYKRIGELTSNEQEYYYNICKDRSQKTKRDDPCFVFIRDLLNGKKKNFTIELELQKISLQ